MDLPSTYKIDALRRKKIARDAFGDMLPASIISRKKKGFDAPVQDYLYKNEGIKSFMSTTLTSDFIREQGLFHPEFAKTMIPAKGGKIKADPHLWWAYVVFQYWYKKNILK